MSTTFCVYRGKIYHADEEENMIEMTSNIQVDGFEPYIDIVGNMHSDFFVKTVSSEDIDLLFSEEYFIKYCGEYFEPFAGCITGLELEDNSVLLFTPSEQLAKKFDFTKDEQFVFKKVVSLDDVEEIKIVKKPILMFSNEKTTEEIIKKADIRSWLATRNSIS